MNGLTGVWLIYLVEGSWKASTGSPLTTCFIHLDEDSPFLPPCFSLKWKDDTSFLTKNYINVWGSTHKLVSKLHEILGNKHEAYIIFHFLWHIYFMTSNTQRIMYIKKNTCHDNHLKCILCTELTNIANLLNVEKPLLNLLTLA